MSSYAVELKHISKSFGAVKANSDVSLSIADASIHAVIGENGAGKSTIMNILYGFYLPDEGEIWIRGKKAHIRNTHDAIALGLGMVHQHFCLAGTLTVTENIILGSEPGSSFLLNYTAAKNRIQELSLQYGLQIDPDATIDNLSVGQQQRVEILKALYRGAQILILDEPTAVLTPQETEEFFKILRSLKAQGKTIVIITHKLAEVLSISDRVTVMRAGKVVGEVETAKTSAEELARMMVGRDVLLKVDRKAHRYSGPSQQVIRVSNLSLAKGFKPHALKNISFEIAAGEIFGIAGVEGNGQTELIEVIAGLTKPTKGQIFLNDIDITNYSPREIKALKIGHIPEDRHRRGLLLDSNLLENSILGLQYTQVTGGTVFDYKKIERHTKTLIEGFDVRPPEPSLQVRGLSGGNQQKLIIAREFSIGPQFLIAAQPTRGVDIGAIEFIYKKLLELKESGAAILLVSAELDEVLSLSDRVGVIYDGQIVAIVDPDTVSQQELGLMMTGSTSSKEQKSVVT
ncbi:MAG: ABC transporter ATP-binding protein [Acidobacteriota bacterium]|nr:ABC transporter ATP-binding protein [Blastocatellia bacterium]MDW8412598.1 ABC transporter ATP-binding protein [Acidobacteriota bacterium]